MKIPSTHSIRAKFQARAGARKSRNWATAAAACAAGLSIVPAVLADINGFTDGQYTFNANATGQGAGRPNITAGELLLTTPVNDEFMSAWFNTAQSVGNFTASFTYTFGGGSNPPADGFAFVLQGAGLNALGGGGGGLGYIGIQNSAAVAFDVYNGGNATRSGFSASGYGGFAYSDTTPVNLRLATPVNVTLAFRDGVFTQTLTQGTSTITKTGNINLADRIGGPTGFVGFTAATGGLNAEQKISNFTFTTGNAPAVPAAAQLITGVPQGGLGFFGVREVLGAPSCCGNLNEAQTAILGSHPNRIDYTAPVINVYDSDTRGRFVNDSLYKLDPDQTTPANDTVNNIAFIATGRIVVPTTGVYTFGVNSDDGFRLTIGGQRFETFAGQGGTTINTNGALEFPNGRGGGESSLGSIFLRSGEYDIQLLNWEGTGGGSVELYSAPGGRTAFDAEAFTLIGGQDLAAKNGKNRVVNVAQWSLKEYTGVANVTDVLNNGRNNTGTQRGTTTLVPTIRYTDLQNQNNGSHGGDALPFPNDGAGDDDGYGAFATTTLTIAAADAGRYTFMMFTDDDARFRIMLNNVPVPLVGLTIGDTFDSDGVNGADQFGTNGCCFDQFGHYDLAEGTYSIEAAFHEGGGGSGFFIYGTQGDRNSFDPAAFQLLGANTDGPAWSIPASESLKLVPEPGAASMLGLAAFGLLARRRRKA